MKTFATFYDYILPEAPGCPAPMVDLHLREVARDFCRRSLAWRQDFDPITTAAHLLTYDLDAPESQAEPVKVLSLFMNGELLWSADETARSHRRCTALKYASHEPPFALSNDLREITLVDEAPVGVLQVNGAMKPSASATSLPDILGTEHREAMRTGTLARLMVMPKKPWQDRELATFYRNQYESYVSHAAVNTQTGNTRHLLRTRKWG